MHLMTGVYLIAGCISLLLVVMLCTPNDHQ